MVTDNCNHDEHRQCHDVACQCGCHVLFALIHRKAS